MRQAKQSLLCLLNFERRRRGLRPVRQNERIVRAAEGHSRAMVRGRFFAHIGPGLSRLAGRLRQSHYLPRRGGAWLVGENIAFGIGSFSSPLRIHRAWMHSTPHRHNMLERRYREVGFGIYSGSPVNPRRGATYTADFGVRRRR